MHSRVSTNKRSTVSKQANLNVNYRRSPISFKSVYLGLEFNTETIVTYRADKGPRGDCYQAVIEGTAENLYTHQFHFQPSVTDSQESKFWFAKRKQRWALRGRSDAIK
jgi:hypothetical protein